MYTRIEELTTDEHRRQGKQVIQISESDGEERLTMELQWESNVSLPGDAVVLKPVAHPPHSSKLLDHLLDLVCALRPNPFTVKPL